MIDNRFSDLAAVVVKVTTRCNLDCAYCYEKISNDMDMSMDTFRKIVGKVLHSTRNDKVLFILHGGEPLIMSDDWLLEAAEVLQVESRMSGKAAKLGMQSNILNLRQSKIATLKRAGISLSASMDGPATLGKGQRPLAGRAQEMFLIAKEAGLQVSVLMTINGSNWQHFDEIMSWLDDELHVDLFKANPVTPVGSGANMPPLEPDQVSFAKETMLNRMFSKPSGVVEDNIMVEMSRYWFRDRSARPASLCRDRKCGAGSRVIAFSPDGAILPCGRFEWNDQSNIVGLLDDLGQDAGDYFRKVEAFHAKKPESWFDCTRCEARSICSFGCQAFITRNKDSLNVECLPTKQTYRWFEDNSDRVGRFFDDYEGQWQYAVKH